MMHYFIGDLGHFFVITSFVTALAAGFSYFTATITNDIAKAQQWKQNGATAFYLHAASVLGISVSLFIIIANHYFEYHYAYSYSDKKLPGYYLISTFWNGQEGSFLLWLFWHAVLGVILILTNRFWESAVMTIFSLVQAFLASMIIGVVVPGLELKIGSSPFILLREAMHNAPVFQTNPEFVPSDGTGLNPLLQNYWMVIHPPTLFLGFATTLIPFSYCIAGLWLKKYTEWIRPALPWALFSGAVLGLGILMGGYWAYETLNFGGYWNWDPVENAVYVPWLILIAAIHTMIAFKNSGTALKASIVLVAGVFILILYSTFLTRSGILGDTSVHSFTDLGLSGQLLLYLLFFLALSVALASVRWKNLPTSDKEASASSREFWIFIGVLVLCLMGFHVLVPTSFPAWNQFVKLFGIESNLAPPPNQIQFYTNSQVWYATAVALLSGIGQYFWWKKIEKGELWKQLQFPLIAAVLLYLVALQITFSTIGGDILKQPVNLLVLFASIFTICLNVRILFSLLRTSPSLSGGSIAHIGIGLVLAGILFSAGYSKVVSLNNTGLFYSKEMSDEFNRENLMLFLNEPMRMADYQIEYAGVRMEPRDKKGYVNPNDVEVTDDPYKVVANKDIIYEGRKLYSEKDTFEIFPENKYYEIVLTGAREKHTLFPRIQENPQMGQAASPDIKRDLTKDLYAHVVMSSRNENDWSQPNEFKVKANQQFFANDYVAKLTEVQRIYAVGNTKLDSADVAVKATITLQGEHQEYIAEPIFIIHNRMVGRIPDVVNDLGVELTLMNIHPETSEFSVAMRTRQKDFIILKALEKPMINILWLGTALVMIGFGIAISRRFREFQKMKLKGLE
jgi:cytochrome c-type biogenesis protein CcmF